MLLFLRGHSPWICHPCSLNRLGLRSCRVVADDLDDLDEAEGSPQPAEGRELVIIDLGHETKMPPSCRASGAALAALSGTASTAECGAAPGRRGPTAWHAVRGSRQANAPAVVATKGVRTLWHLSRQNERYGPAAATSVDGCRLGRSNAETSW